MPILGFFPGGGMDTSDATATADDIRAGKTAYTADGLTTGTLTMKHATGSITVAANATVSIALDFAPLAAVTTRTDAGNRNLNATMVYDDDNSTEKHDKILSVYDSAVQGYFQEFKPVGNTLSITARAYPASATYTWYAIGL